MDQNFYDFWNVVFSKGDHGKTVTSFLKRISGDFASISDCSALFSKEIVKDVRFVFEVCNIIIMIN